MPAHEQPVRVQPNFLNPRNHPSSPATCTSLISRLIPGLRRHKTGVAQTTVRRCRKQTQHSRQGPQPTQPTTVRPYFSSHTGKSHIMAHTVLSGIYDTILVRDISQFLQIRNPLVFNDVARYLADTTGSPVSTTKIENRLRSAHRPASNETIERYISGLLNAFLFYNAQRIDVKGGAYLQGLAKYYPADLGIRNMLLGYSTEDFGFLLENAVHNELKIRGYQIRVGKIGKAEIDFVATRQRADLTEEKLYIQVSASILDEHTRERELSPLLNARDLSAKRMVLTLDRFGLGKSDGVTVANAIDWMLGK